MTTHSSILAWRILWPEESGRLQSVGSRRVGQDWGAEQQQQGFLFLGGGPASLWGSPRFPVHKDAQTLPGRCLPAPLRQRQPAFTKSFNSSTTPCTTCSHNLTEHLLHMRLTLRWKPHGSWLRGTQSRKCLKFFSQYRQNSRSQIQFQPGRHWRQPAEWLPRSQDHLLSSKAL